MTSQPSSEPPVTEFAGQLLFRLWRASHTRAAAALDAVGLTPALFALLNVIGAHDGAIQQELGRLMGVDPSTMVSLIDQLETSGLAQRRPRATDRRAREIAITRQGRRALARARQAVSDAEEDVLRGLTQAERRELKSLLRQALASAPAQPLWTSAEED